MRAKVSIGTSSLIFCTLVALIYYFAVRPQGGLTSVESWGGSGHHGIKTQPYVGWSLADAEFDDIEPRKARILFYIMVAGWNELAGLDAILPNLYHEDHFFLIHMDIKANAKARDQVKRRITQTLEKWGKGQRNIRLVEPATPITWGGFTMTLNAVYGLTQGLHWTSKWDYFINLSASDLPLLTTDEIADVLGEHKAQNTSFIKGFMYHPSWEGYKFVDRREMFAEDVSLMRDNEPERMWPWAILDQDKNMLTRPPPELFTVYKGEFWVILHRNMATYIHKSPDNQARVLLAYFSGMMVSDEEFFQTVACNPHFPSHTLKTHDDNLRFVNWWGDSASPSVITPERAVAAANSGAIFGRKFATKTPEGKDGVSWIEAYLKDDSRSASRVARVKRRLSERMGPERKPQGFCGKRQEMDPPEAFFAIEGEEEKLSRKAQSPQAMENRGGGRRQRRLDVTGVVDRGLSTLVDRVEGNAAPAAVFVGETFGALSQDTN